MFNTPEKITAVSKHSYQAQMTLLHQVGEKILEGGHKLLSLHVQTSKKLLEDGKASANQWLHSKSPLEFWSQRSQQFRPTIDHILQYETRFAKILTETQSELLNCSLKETITLQDGLAHLNAHAEVESKNTVKAAAKPSAVSKPTAAKPAIKATHGLTAVPANPQVTKPQAEPQLAPQLAPQTVPQAAHQAALPEIHAAPAVESAVPHIDEQAPTSIEPPQAN